ncbi:hypothetical protein [Paenibacillus sp. FSL P2-0136]|uniref:hypothetical protein n=1 Tax=unclassified Paenibacillus TaxID=185978 RepID=UPI0030DB84DC
MFDDIDFSPGLITYIETRYLDQEDIFQVSYFEGKYTLDVGWYRKEFAVYVIRAYDWENPLLEKRCTEAGMLHALVHECSVYVRDILSR